MGVSKMCFAWHGAFKLPNHVIPTNNTTRFGRNSHNESIQEACHGSWPRTGLLCKNHVSLAGVCGFACVALRACVCWCVYVYKCAEPEQANMFTGELIQSADADPRPPRQAGVGAEQVWNRHCTLRMCNHGFIKYYRRNIIGRLTFSLWAGRAVMINKWLMLTHLQGHSGGGGEGGWKQLQSTSK